MDKLAIKNFKESDYFSFESSIKLWKKNKSVLLIDFGEEANRKEMLIKYIDKINDLTEWVNENKEVIGKFLISNRCISIAEEWVSSNEEVERNCYIMPNGQKIILPIIETDFFNAMYVDSVLIDFEEDESRPDTTVHILFNPDYFSNHSIIVYIDGDKNIEYGDIAG